MNGIDTTRDSPVSSASPARSYLFVPGDRPERFGKALAAGADRVVFDLEDAVAPASKPAARDAVGMHLASLAPAERLRCVVRINDASTPWFQDDLALMAGLEGVELMLPKAEHAEAIAATRERCPGTAVLALIESALGMLNAREIATAPGVQRLVFGTIDFALDLDLSGEPAGFDAAASQLAWASRAAGILAPVAGVTPQIDDDEILCADVARFRAHGFGAKLCIHPRQVAVLHAALRPSEADVAWAQRVIATADGQPGAIRVDGRMVDRPVLQRAHAVLARAARP